jgi:hypothetical protein
MLGPEKPSRANTLGDVGQEGLEGLVKIGQIKMDMSGR